MSVSFTAFEIFEIAEQIERNAAKFYRKAAEKTADKAMRHFFGQLAEMEDNHEKAFAEMRKNLVDDARDTMAFDPGNEMAYYLKAMATNAGWEGKVLPGIELAGSETPKQILAAAIGAERASIDYYLGLKTFVPSQAGKDKVEKIIKEEMKHVIMLQKHLEQMS
ncbi:MAG: ferritin family protein [Phycisphaerae bacterium]|jgi:rubrerythrin